MEPILRALKGSSL